MHQNFPWLLGYMTYKQQKIFQNLTFRKKILKKKHLRFKIDPNKAKFLILPLPHLPLPIMINLKILQSVSKKTSWMNTFTVLETRFRVWPIYYSMQLILMFYFKSQIHRLFLKECHFPNICIFSLSPIPLLSQNLLSTLISISSWRRSTNRPQNFLFTSSLA